MKKIYSYPLFSFFLFFLFACEQPSELELTTSELSSSCQQSLTPEICKSLIPLYVANTDSFTNTNWFQEKNLCLWTGVNCNTENQWIRLNLSSRHLSKLPPQSFIKLPSLQILYLSQNRLTTLESNTFQGLSNLQHLDLSENQIDTLATSAFSTLSKLRYLDLSANNITTLNPNIFLTYLGW